MVRHAEVIRDEINQLNEEFLQLVDASGVFTPVIRFLMLQYKNKAPASAGWQPQHPYALGKHSHSAFTAGLSDPIFIFVFLVKSQISRVR